MSDDITTDQATYDALVRDAILWRKGKTMRPDDMIVWEAWGMVQQFAQSNPACPEYFRGRVKEYQDRIAASRTVPEQLYPNLEQPDTRDAAPVPACPYIRSSDEGTSYCAIAAVPAREWIPVGERLPTHNYSVLAAVIESPNHYCNAAEPLRDVCSYLPKERRWIMSDGDGDITVKVSHWQDLPDIPPPPAADK